jgi:Ion channel
VMLLLFIWASLAVVAFALIYQGCGSRFEERGEPVGFGTLIYMSGSTFLTLGLGDVTSLDSLGRMFMVLEAATGFVFLGLIITYMPLLDQAYALREVGGLLLQSRAGKPPSAVRFLRRYAGTDRAELLRGHLREGEQWMADILQSHLSHPVLCFYRAQHYGQSWLVSLTTLMDTSSLLIVGGEGIVREQARLAYRMGLLLLTDLTSALGLRVPERVDSRLTEADLPALRAALSSAGIAVRLGPTEGTELVRINHRYDVYLHVMSRWLMITLPPWIPPMEERPSAQGPENTQAWPAIKPGMTDTTE